MAQRKNQPTVANGGVVRPFPPEAYDYDEDVDAKTVAAMRDELGVDFSSDEWEVVDGFGRVIHAA